MRFTKICRKRAIDMGNEIFRLNDISRYDAKFQQDQREDDDNDKDDNDNDDDVNNNNLV